MEINLSELVKKDMEKFTRDQELGLNRAGRLLVDKLKEVVGVQGSKGVHAPHGQPPYRQSGALQKGIRMRRSKNVVEITSSAPYGVYLDVKGHPWFISTIERNEAEVRAIIFGGE